MDHHDRPNRLPDRPPLQSRARPGRCLGRWLQGLTLPQAEAVLDCLATYRRPPAEIALGEDGSAVLCPA